MIDDLQRLNALVGQCFDERMVAQAETVHLPETEYVKIA